jgi:kynurenine formamidase
MYRFLILTSGVLMLLVLLAGCVDPAASLEPRPQQQTLSFSRVIDLSHTITQNMPHMPEAVPTQLLRAADGSLGGLRIDTESGTTLELPAPAGRQSPTTEYFSPRNLVLPAVVLDVREAAHDNPNYRLSAEEIEAWERQHGPIPAGSMVLLATGWDIRWGNPAAYLNLEAQQPQVPGIGGAAARLLQERRVSGVGSDTPAAPDTTLPPWLRLHNLTNVEQLPPTGTTLMIGALRIQGSSTSPVRVLALVP